MRRDKAVFNLMLHQGQRRCSVNDMLKPEDTHDHILHSEPWQNQSDKIMTESAGVDPKIPYTAGAGL
jgi:hypothetical protein